MISASEFRKGVTFEINGDPNVVLDFQHVKPGKGAAFVRTKYKNILTGATREEAFNPDDQVSESAHRHKARCNISIPTENCITSWIEENVRSGPS